MVQILCALLASMPLDAELTHLYRPRFNAPRRVSHFMLAIELQAFVDPAQIRQRLSGLLALFRQSPSLEETAVAVAGDYERRTRAERLAEGIPISPEERDVLAPYLESSDTAISVSGAARG
ncbi:MAG TPA: Ldh family oxidoreductase [Bryobacteraceae bacterium]|nr:Ldh family oxidoreductase [Bryobacteraceae bacterium]